MLPKVYESWKFRVCALENDPKQAGRNSGGILRLFNCNDRVFFAIAGCAKAKMSTYFSKANQSLPVNVKKKKVRIKPETFLFARLKIL